MTSHRRTRANRKPQHSHSRLSCERLEDRQLLAAWYASPTGAATNAGTLASPWDLSTALTKVNVIDPGDTLYLRGGTYVYPNRVTTDRGWDVHLEGAANAPVTVRPYADEHVILDGGLESKVSTTSRYLVITGLEVLVSENLTQSRTTTKSGSGYPSEFNRPLGGIVFSTGYNIKIINNVVHAGSGGIGFGANVGGGSEIYGNLIYDNGWIGADRQHGHGIYSQNATPDWQYVRDNLIFDNYSEQMQAYGSEIASIDRFYIARNMFWTTGISEEAAILLGGLNPSESIRVYDNVGYEGNLRIGYVDGGNDAIVTGNRIFHGGIEYTQWTNLTRNDNFTWGTNSPPKLDGVQVAPPTTPSTYLYANTYDANRANVAIQNFPNWTQVAVDPTGFLQVGDTYRLLNPTDLWGAPVQTGTYTGTPINIAMSGPFAAYVMVKSAGNTAPTISNITDSAVTAGTAIPLKSFTVGDAQTAAGSLTLTAQSSNTALVPVANLVFGGSGASRTLQVTPAAGLTGSSTITVTVRDAGGLTASDTFVVTVNPANTAPTITNITDSAVTVGTAIPLKSFTVGDAQTAAGSLTLSAQSSNAALVPVANLVFGGSGASRTLQVTPAAGVTGSSTITVTVRDAGGLTTSDTFVVTVNPVSANTAPTISNITDSVVTAGTAVPLKSFTVGDAQTAAGSLTLTAVSSNTTLVPVANLVFGGSGASRTLQVTPKAGVTGSSTITVTVRDAGGLTASDTFVVTVNPASGNTAPTISNIADTSVPFGTTFSQKSFTIGDAQTPIASLTLTLDSSNKALIPLANLILLGTGAGRQLIVIPVAGLSGSSTITVTVRDAGGLTASDTFRFTVQGASLSMTTSDAGPTVSPQSNVKTAARADAIDASLELAALDRYFELEAERPKRKPVWILAAATAASRR